MWGNVIDLSEGWDTFHQELYLNFYQPEVVAAAKEYHAVEQSSGGDIRVLEEYVGRRKARTLERLKVRFYVAGLLPHRPMPFFHSP